MRGRTRQQKSSHENKELETVEFSDSVLKVNAKGDETEKLNEETKERRLRLTIRTGKEQERELIITNKAIYNFLPRKFSAAKRIIRLDSLKALVLGNSTDDVLFQVGSEEERRRGRSWW